MKLINSRILFGLVTMGLLYTLSGSGLEAYPPQGRQEALDTFEKVFNEVLNRYVTEVDAGKLVEAGIEGMLSELDPYTQFIVESNSHRIDALTNGEYGGVGIRLGQLGDTLVVVSPMEGTPAQRFGILAGDHILKIDSIRTRNLSLDDAAKLVRGEAGTDVQITVRREGLDAPLVFNLTRELIRVPDVSYSGLIESGIGYIKLTNFSRFTAENLEQAIRKLQQTPLDGLILDLRGNPGGLLSAALQSSDLFIPEDELLLETKGRVSRSNRRFYARRPAVLYPDVQLMVLIDQGSASASEILAGVIQDYDRGVILGRTSFGKGLVQTVYNLAEETRLKVTTAKYYLPSGRLIQRKSFGDELRLDDLLESDTLMFNSEAHREMKGGGGITPDVPVERYVADALESELWRRGSFFKFSVQYAGEHPELGLPVSVDSSALEEFRQWLTQPEYRPSTAFSEWLQHVPLDSTDIWLGSQDSILDLISSIRAFEDVVWQAKFDEQSDRIQRGLEMEISNVLGGLSARVSASLKGDPAIATAMSLIRAPGAAEALLKPNYLTTPE